MTENSTGLTSILAIVAPYALMIPLLVGCGMIMYFLEMIQDQGRNVKRICESKAGEGIHTGDNHCSCIERRLGSSFYWRLWFLPLVIFFLSAAIRVPVPSCFSLYPLFVLSFRVWTIASVYAVKRRIAKGDDTKHLCELLNRYTDQKQRFRNNPALKIMDAPVPPSLLLPSVYGTAIGLLIAINVFFGPLVNVIVLWCMWLDIVLLDCSGMLFIARQKFPKLADFSFQEEPLPEADLSAEYEAKLLSVIQNPNLTILQRNLAAKELEILQTLNNARSLRVQAALKLE